MSAFGGKAVIVGAVMTVRFLTKADLAKGYEISRAKVARSCKPSATLRLLQKSP